jgi:ABC-type nitrate/sulfonate/bicarbonate transport system ATPase subunit
MPGAGSIFRLVEAAFSNDPSPLKSRCQFPPVKIVGMAFQDTTLLPWRTTLDNVLLQLEIVGPCC